MIRPSAIRVEFEATKVEEEITTCRVDKLQVVTERLLWLTCRDRLTGLQKLSLN
jgi:hypothetical protein